MTLTPTESRVLGVLIEKSTTTPDQYPLSLNAATNGANQKNNRDPVLNLAEDEVFTALEGLRAKQLVIRVDIPGNRTNKYRHNASEILHLRPGELAILAELLLRGPQTLGELRGRASRMAAIESLEVAKGLITALMTRETPLAKELPPAPGTRAERFTQLLCPMPFESNLIPKPVQAAASEESSLGERVAALEAKIDALEKIIQQFALKS